MRIALVAGPHLPVPPKQYGGTEQVISNLIVGLKEAGHTPILLAPADSEVECELWPIIDASLSFPKNRRHIDSFDQKLKAANLRTKQLLQDNLNKFELIHSHGYDLLEFKNFPNLTTLHGPFNMDELKYYEKRKELFYMSISKNQQVAFPDLQYVGVAYNGQDVSKFPFVDKPEDYVCFLGRFDREKNPHLAIELALNLGIKIKLAGKIDYLGEGYFAEEVEKYFDHPLVEYLGELGFEDKVQLISKARCNIHPTGFREPFGLSVIEAAYCGTPTIAIARGSMPELIEDGRTGLLVEDLIESYHRIEECFGMDRRYVSSRARLLFNYKTMTQQYIDAYTAVREEFANRKHQDSLFRRLFRDHGRKSNTYKSP